MATVTSKPSSSSPASSTRPNPGARNSESKDPMRRSFSGNPFSKPSSILPNSRDFVRRSSIARESASSLRDFTDKENGKETNLNIARVRSPASALKGTKNFMSPTISAASKFTASPKKKILTERNEPVLSSVSSSDAKSQLMQDNELNPEKSSIKKKAVSFSDVKSLILEDDGFLKPEMGLNQSKIEASYDSTITELDEEALKSDLVSDSEVNLESKKNHVSSLPKNVTEENDSGVNLGSTFKISPRTSCSTLTPMLAPLDADPSMPPYDPKTNYLSPRPRFLHYRPNPRIELFHKRVGMRLEESFVSESFSDSEVSGILSDDSHRESEDVSSDETMKEGEVEAAVEEEETELTVSEPNPFSFYKPEESVQAKGVSKSKFFTSSKFIAFIFVLLFAGLSISVVKSPVTDFSVLNDLDFSNLYVLPEITEFAIVNFERLAQRYQLWAANSFSYICKLISDLRKVPKLGPLQYGNLTDLFEEYKEADAVFKQDQAVLTPIWERDVGAELSKEGDSESETDENVEEVLEEDNSPKSEEQVHQGNAEVSEYHTDPEPEEACSTPPAEGVEISEAEQSGDHNDIKPQTDQLELILEATVIQPEAEAYESQGESEKNFHAEFVSPKVENFHQSSELDIAMDNPQISAATADITTMNGSEVKFFTANMVGISMLVLLSLLAKIAFLKYAHKEKSSTPNAIPTHVQQPSKKFDYSLISVTSEHQQTEEVDMAGESCSSEMSSFKSSSYSKKGLKDSSEAQTKEKKIRKNSRRESLASSDFSMDSPSYGSFTTYEKITKKNGLDDEVVTTPVRRSSRLRNQAATSS
ncbi:uncharacterized protein LOC123227634 [Mangifera indica]|uniref:uncharacterized protein LOC123227634 n=1 Tax=Mangifera indica TaxID=29780 RepID=UPI001CF97DCE|nr:uncharacterized protein LOC123227634 [Mangifera indica]